LKNFEIENFQLARAAAMSQSVQSPRGASAGSSASRPGSNSSLRSAALSLVGTTAVGTANVGPFAVSGSRPSSSGLNQQGGNATFAALIGASSFPSVRPGSGQAPSISIPPPSAGRSVGGGRRSAGGRSPGRADIFDETSSVASSVRGSSAGNGRLNHDAMVPTFGGRRSSNGNNPLGREQLTGAADGLGLVATRHPAIASSSAASSTPSHGVSAQAAPKVTSQPTAHVASSSSGKTPLSGATRPGSSGSTTSAPIVSSAPPTPYFDLGKYLASSTQPISEIPSELFSSLLPGSSASAIAAASGSRAVGTGTLPTQEEQPALDDETEARLRAAAAANATSSRAILEALERRIKKLGVTSPLEDREEREEAGEGKEEGDGMSRGSRQNSPHKVAAMTFTSSPLPNRAGQPKQNQQQQGGGGAAVSPSTSYFANSPKGFSSSSSPLSSARGAGAAPQPQSAPGEQNDGDEAAGSESKSPERERLARLEKIRQGLAAVVSLDEELEAVSRVSRVAGIHIVKRM
jgi:hypothetical protein